MLFLTPTTVPGGIFDMLPRIGGCDSLTPEYPIWRQTRFPSRPSLDPCQPLPALLGLRDERCPEAILIVSPLRCPIGRALRCRRSTSQCRDGCGWHELNSPHLFRPIHQNIGCSRFPLSVFSIRRKSPPKTGSPSRRTIPIVRWRACCATNEWHYSPYLSGWSIAVSGQPCLPPYQSAPNRDAGKPL